MKDPVEVQPPGGNRLFIAPRVKMSRNHISFTLLDDPPSDLRHHPEMVSEVLKLHHRCDLPRQLVDCLTYRVVELIQPLPVQPSVEGGTDVGAD